MRTTLTLALLLMTLIVIAGLVAGCFVMPWWMLPVYIVAGSVFGSSVGEMLEAIWADSVRA